MTFKSWALALASLFSGILVDTDHIVDYIIPFGLNFKKNDFFQMCYEDKLPKVRLIFHAWEWLVLWGVTALLTDWNPWITGILIGTGQHIMLDILNNHANVNSYSLLWRWNQGFEVKKVFPKNFITEKKL